MIDRLAWLMPAVLATGCAAPAQPSAVSLAARPAAVSYAGSYVEQSVSSPAIVEFAEVARKQLAGPMWLNDPDLKLLQVLKAEQQSAGGINVRMTMLLKLRGQTRWARVVLFLGFYGQHDVTSVQLGQAS